MDTPCWWAQRGDQRQDDLDCYIHESKFAKNLSHTSRNLKRLMASQRLPVNRQTPKDIARQSEIVTSKSNIYRFTL